MIEAQLRPNEKRRRSENPGAPARLTFGARAGVHRARKRYDTTGANMSNRPNRSPYSTSRDDNVGAGHAFDQEGDDDQVQQGFTANALAADQLPTSGHDQARSTTPTRFSYPNPGPGGRLAD